MRCWCGDTAREDNGKVVCVGSPAHDPKASPGNRPLRRLYVSGPMTGYPECNYPVFRSVSAELRRAGWEVVNPADSAVRDGHYVDFLRDDIRSLLDCDGVALLDGWWGSRGAQVEVHVAGVLQMPCRPWEDWVLFMDSVNDEIKE